MKAKDRRTLTEGAMNHCRLRIHLNSYASRPDQSWAVQRLDRRGVQRHRPATTAPAPAPGAWAACTTGHPGCVSETEHAHSPWKR